MCPFTKVVQSLNPLDQPSCGEELHAECEGVEIPTRVGNTRYVLLKVAGSLTLQRHGNGKQRSIEMKPSSSVLLTVFFTVLVVAVSEVASAQETGSDRGVQKTPVSPAVNVAEGVGTAASQPGGADGTGNPVLGRHRRPLYRFNKSDVIEVSFAFAPEFNQVATVQPDGFITLRDAGHLMAEGSTAEELEAAIAAAYVKLLHDPQVTVGLKDFDHPYFIAGGEVGRPGKYELRGELKVSAAVAIAGGFTEHAKHSQVVLFRRVTADLVETRVLNVKEMLKQRNLREDPSLQAGDYVFVPRSAISKIMRFMPATSMGMYSSAPRF